MAASSNPPAKGFCRGHQIWIPGQSYLGQNGSPSIGASVVVVGASVVVVGASVVVVGASVVVVGASVVVVGASVVLVFGVVVFVVFDFGWVVAVVVLGVAVPGDLVVEGESDVLGVVVMPATESEVELFEFLLESFFLSFFLLLSFEAVVVAVVEEVSLDEASVTGATELEVEVGVCPSTIALRVTGSPSSEERRLKFTAKIPMKRSRANTKRPALFGLLSPSLPSFMHFSCREAISV